MYAIKKQEWCEKVSGRNEMKRYEPRPLAITLLEKRPKYFHKRGRTQSFEMSNQ